MSDCMWRRLLHILVAVAILIPTLTGFSKVTRYFIEYENYKKFCKNRENSKIICNGLCRLSEEIAAEETPRDLHQPVIPNVEHILPLFFGLTKVPDCVHISQVNDVSEPVFYFLLYNSQEFIKELLKPPTPF